MVAAKPDSVSCGYTGIYESPTKSGDSECYRMTVDCKQNSIMKVTAYECSTGITHDSKLRFITVHRKSIINRKTQMYHQKLPLPITCTFF